LTWSVGLVVLTGSGSRGARSSDANSDEVDRKRSIGDVDV